MGPSTKENIFFAGDVEITTRQICEKILKEIKGMNNVMKQKNDTPSLVGGLQHSFSYKPTSALEKCIYELMLTYAIKAEKKSPGSIDEFFSRLTDLFSGNFQAHDEETKNSIVACRATSLDLNKFVWDSLRSVDSKLCDMLIQSLDLVGFGGKIIIEKSCANVDSIELIKGYTFDLQACWPGSFRMDNAKAVIIDGFVESVSEIHHLLEHFHDSKDTGVLLVRGAAPDVLSTLRVNWDRGSLKLLPIIVPFDIDGINTLVDIAVVSGSDVTSSNKGDLISAIKCETLPTIQSIDVHDAKLCIRNDKTYSAVVSHVSFLRKRQDAQNDVSDVSSLYDRRIRTLTPNHVVLRLKDDYRYVWRSQHIDLALRKIKSLVDFGVKKDASNRVQITSLHLHFFARELHRQLIGIGSIIL
jgi:hypothetical protein